MLFLKQAIEMLGSTQLLIEGFEGKYVLILMDLEFELERISAINNNNNNNNGNNNNNSNNNNSKNDWQQQ